MFLPDHDKPSLEQMGFLELLEPEDQVRSTAVHPDELVEIPYGLVKIGHFCRSVGTGPGMTCLQKKGSVCLSDSFWPYDESRQTSVRPATTDLWYLADQPKVADTREM